MCATVLCETKTTLLQAFAFTRYLSQKTTVRYKKQHLLVATVNIHIVPFGQEKPEQQKLPGRKAIKALGNSIIRHVFVSTRKVCFPGSYVNTISPLGPEFNAGQAETTDFKIQTFFKCLNTLEIDQFLFIRETQLFWALFKQKLRF